jgi:beta-glucanase (GH16 family)
MPIAPRCVAPLAVALIALLLATLGPGPARAAGAPAGWRLAFSEDFDGSSLDHSRWATYEGPYAGAQRNYWRPDDVLVSGGEARIRIQRRSFGGRSITSGGMVNVSLSQTYGRYEFRAKIPAGKGIDSYATLWPKDGDANATLVELLAPGPETAYLTNAYGSGKTGKQVRGRLSDGFHTYTIEWAPSRFRILFDGTVWLSDSHVSRVPKSFGLAVGSGDNLTGTPDASTELPAFFEIDWVRVYRYDATAGATTTTRPAPTTTRARPARTTTTAAAPVTTAQPPDSGSPATTALALAGDPASDRHTPPLALPAVVVLVAVLALGSTVIALRARRPRSR